MTPSRWFEVAAIILKRLGVKPLHHLQHRHGPFTAQVHAKMAVREGVAPNAIDVRKLQEELIAKGAYLRNAEDAVVA